MRQTSRVLSTVLITDVQKDEFGFQQVQIGDASLGFCCAFAYSRKETDKVEEERSRTLTYIDSDRVNSKTVCGQSYKKLPLLRQMSA